MARKARTSRGGGRIGILLALLTVAPPMVHGQSVPYVDCTLAQAFERAEAQDKAVFVHFYTDWCVPSRMLDQYTLNHADVIPWLRDKMIAVRVNAEAEPDLVARYKVDLYPTLLLLTPTGEELSRLTGYIQPRDFAQIIEAAISGTSPPVTRRYAMEPVSTQDPMARMDSARALVQDGKYEEAMEKFLWCYDEGLKHNKAFHGVRLTFLLNDLARLGERYPQARSALQERRQDVLTKVRANEASELNVAELAALNRALGEDALTLAVYDELKDDHPHWPIVALLRRQVFDQLRAARRYQELYEELDLSHEVEKTFLLAEPDVLANEVTLRLTTAQRQELEQAKREVVIENLADYYEILIGAGRLDQAEKLARRVLKLDDSAPTYNALAWHGYLTGCPIEANARQARKAYQLSGGSNGVVADTLVRVLDSLGHRDEARKVFHEALAQAADPYGRVTLEHCGTALGFLKPTTKRPHELLLAFGLLAAILVIVLILVFRSRRRERNPYPVAGVHRTRL